MKKGFTIVLALVLLTACGGAENGTDTDSGKNKSEKGNWSESDMKLANMTMRSIDDDLEALGDNKQAYIDCYIDKLEKNYSSFLAADSDASGCRVLAMECAELLKPASVAGDWSDEDKQKADDAIAAIDSQLDILGDSKQAYIDCYLEKIENAYPSFDKANADMPGCKVLAEDCATTLLELM